MSHVAVKSSRVIQGFVSQILNSDSKVCSSGTMADDPASGSSAQPATRTNLSPLTFGKVFGAIPRVTGVNTPNINHKIAKLWGLPPVDNSAEFKRIYVDGRAILR